MAGLHDTLSGSWKLSGTPLRDASRPAGCRSAALPGLQESAPSGDSCVPPVGCILRCYRAGLL